MALRKERSLILSCHCQQVAFYLGGYMTQQHFCQQIQNICSLPSMNYGTKSSPGLAQNSLPWILARRMNHISEVQFESPDAVQETPAACHPAAVQWFGYARRQGTVVLDKEPQQKE